MDIAQFNVINGSDNVVRIALYAKGVALADLAAITRATVDFGGAVTLVDSAVVGSSVIWWTDSETYRGASTDVLSLSLGGQSIPAGTYEDVKIKIYSAAYDDGLQVENRLRAIVT